MYAYVCDAHMCVPCVCTCVCMHVPCVCVCVCTCAVCVRVCVCTCAVCAHVLCVCAVCVHVCAVRVHVCTHMLCVCSCVCSKYIHTVHGGACFNQLRLYNDIIVYKYTIIMFMTPELSCLLVDFCYNCIHCSLFI